MDPNSSLSLVLNAINSQVSSMISSFGRLKLYLTTDRGRSFDRVPNEIMQLILAKVNRNDDDVRKLIRLRLVSTRWSVMVEDYCQKKKSLFVVMKPISVPSQYSFRHLDKRFYGFANLNDFARLVLSTQVPPECFRSLRITFPNIVQLSIRCVAYHEPTRVSDLVEYIHSLGSLKQLDLYGPFVAALSNLSPTLSTLEHFSFETNLTGKLSDNEQRQLFSNLGPNCVRINFGSNIRIDCNQIRQWQLINSHWLTNLTHLHLNIYGDSDKFAQVVRLLSEHSTSLKLLNLYFCADRDKLLMITPSVIDSLGRLIHLTELKLWHIAMNISELDLAAAQQRLGSLSSVVTCELCFSDGRPIKPDLFTRVLSVIFPNLVELDLDLTIIGKKVPSVSVLEYEIEQHLEHRFTNLRKYKIEVFN